LAVLVNGKTTPVPGGTPRYEPRTPEELQQIQNLVSRAAGIDKKRGDTLEVVNLPFTQMVEMSSEGAGVGLTGIGPIVQAVAAVVIALLVVFMIARPLLSQLKEISPELVEAAALPGSVEDVAQALEEAERDARSRKLMEQRQALIELAQDDPQRAADIIRSWLGDEVHSDA
jgi:flagellar M-ring protein FliF